MEHDRIKATNIVGSPQNIAIEKVDICPKCNKQQAIKPFQAFYIDRPHFNTGQVVPFAIFQCADLTCQQVFMVEYKLGLTGRIFLKDKFFPSLLQKVELSADIKDLSESFCEIYRQSVMAESYGLSLIAGAGYRKALEFLVKDFCISNNKDKEKDIKDSALSVCIKNFIEDEKVKKTASRASWLGNDEVHYTRKWSNKDITDLKDLIRLVIYHINMSVLYDKATNFDDEDHK